MIDTAQKVLQEPSVLNGALFTISALFGQVANFGVRWLRKEAVCFLHYFFRDHWRLSLAAFITNVVGIVSAIALVGLEGQKPMWIIATGIGLGFMADSIINKGRRVKYDKEDKK